MSSRIDQLKSLLGRVEERRNAPRLRAVPAALGGSSSAAPAALPSNDWSDVSRSVELARPAERISTTPERAKPPSPTPLENAIAGGLSPTPVPGTGPDELVLDDFEPPQTAVSRAPASPRGGEAAHRTAPTVPQTDPFASDPFASSPPPAPAAVVAPAPAARAPAPTAPTARIAAPELAASAPVARAMTRARVDTPRTFGELLELSLALRPRE